MVAGIDVGGPKKGFHAVALARDSVETRRSADAREIASWCEAIGAEVIAVDAPCAWSTTGRGRAAERELVAKRMWCFATPTREVAVAHPKCYYGWMLAGEALFAALAPRWTLYAGRAARKRVVFETFPHAISCALAGEPVSAKTKRRTRRELLQRAGIDTGRLKSIDDIDAGLCALTARLFLEGKTVDLGDRESGFIVLPALTIPGSRIRSR